MVPIYVEGCAFLGAKSSQCRSPGAECQCQPQGSPFSPDPLLEFHDFCCAKLTSFDLNHLSFTCFTHAFYDPSLLYNDVYERKNALKRVQRTLEKAQRRSYHMRRRTTATGRQQVCQWRLHGIPGRQLVWTTLSTRRSRRSMRT